MSETSPWCARCHTLVEEGTQFCDACSRTPKNIGTCLILFLGLLLMAAIVPSCGRGGGRARDQGLATACKSNLKNIGTALEMYSTDNKGRFPRRLAQVTPNYLKVLPTCPTVGAETYSGGYVSGSNPDAYTVVCRGANHRGVSYSANFPQYTSTQGLLEH